MKVIFLDIAGVLNRASTPNPRKFPYIVDKRLLARLKSLVKRSGREGSAFIFMAARPRLDYSMVVPLAPAVSAASATSSMRSPNGY